MAESVPAKPAFSTQKLTKAEHQGVSSLDAIAPPRLVERRYSTIRGLAPEPGTSETPRSSSCIAMSNHGKAATGASAMNGCKYFKEAQPVWAPWLIFCQWLSAEGSMDSATSPRSSIAMTLPSVLGVSRKFKAEAVTTSCDINISI